MFCSSCGKELNSGDRFCSQCGTMVLTETAAKEQLDSGKLLVVDPETHAQSFVQLTEEKAKAINAECKDDDYYINLINNWELDARIKDFCVKLVKMTHTIGGYVLRVGKWVLNLVKDLIVQIKEKLPNMVLGGIVGFAFGMVFSTIPILGWLLGSTVTALAVIFGAGLGLLNDTSNSQIAKKVSAELLRAQGLAA